MERDAGCFACGRAGIIGTLDCASELNSAMVATAKPLIEPNAQNQYQVSSEDLPLCCPMPQACVECRKIGLQLLPGTQEARERLLQRRSGVHLCGGGGGIAAGDVRIESGDEALQRWQEYF